MLGELIAAHGEMRRMDLLRLARERINPDLSMSQLDAEIDADDGLETVGDVVRTVGDRTVMEKDEPAPEPAAEPGDGEARTFARIERMVAVDLETVLRYTERHPDGERTIFQVGALRFGSPAWTASAPAFDHFIRGPENLAERIVKPDLRETVQAEGGDPAEVLSAFLAYIEDAEALVA